MVRSSDCFTRFRVIATNPKAGPAMRLATYVDTVYATDRKVKRKSVNTIRSAVNRFERFIGHVGTIGDLDFYMLPDAKGFVSMQRHLIGDTDATLQRLREEVF